MENCDPCTFCLLVGDDDARDRRWGRVQANAGAIAKVVACVFWREEEDVAEKEDVARVAEATAEEAMMVESRQQLNDVLEQCCVCDCKCEFQTLVDVDKSSKCRHIHYYFGSRIRSCRSKVDRM